MNHPVLFVVLIAVCLCATPVSGKQPLVSPAVYKAVQNAEKQLENAAYSKALQPLKVLLSETKSGSYNQAVLWRTIGVVYTAQGNYKAAIEAFKKSLADDVLPEQQRLSAQYNLAQVYLALEQYRNALQILKPWIAAHQSPTVDETLLLAQLYSRLGQYNKALVYAKRLLQISKNPSEKQYQLVVALEFQLKKYADAAGLLERLVQHYPENKRYWQQLVASYQFLGNYSKAAAVKDLAYRSNLINSADDILQLVQLYQSARAPLLAARFLEKEVKSGKISVSAKTILQLSDLWLQEREYQKAAKTLSKAAKRIDSGPIYQRLGALYFEIQDWKSAYQAYKSAVQKSGLKKPGEAWLLYGMSAYQARLNDEARQAFQKAMSYAYSRASAQQWLKTVNGAEF